MCCRSLPLSGSYPATALMSRTASCWYTSSVEARGFDDLCVALHNGVDAPEMRLHDLIRWEME